MFQNLDGSHGAERFDEGPTCRLESARSQGGFGAPLLNQGPQAGQLGLPGSFVHKVERPTSDGRRHPRLKQLGRMPARGLIPLGGDSGVFEMALRLTQLRLALAPKCRQRSHR